MKKTIVGSLLLLGAVFAAQAQTTVAFRPLIGTGLTGGGDKLATVTFTDGTTQDIRGGGLASFYGGGEAKIGDAFTLQATLGYHIDSARAARNGTVRFTRYPLDVLALFHVNDRVRLGAGVQYVSSAKLVGTGVASNVYERYSASTGAVVTGEYLFTNKLGLALRAVSQRFEPKSGGPSASGDHVGLMLNYYFF